MLTHIQKNENVYVIISEGELYEGSTWEALLLLGSLKLKNVSIILDVNNNIILGDPRNLLNLGILKKLGFKYLLKNVTDMTL